MVLKATLQKECPKQSLPIPKVTSETVVPRCSSLRPATLFKRNFKTGIFCEYCETFTKSFFYRTPPVASVDLLFWIKNNVGWFLLRFLDLVIVRYLHIISRNHFNMLLLINLQKKLVQSKAMPLFCCYLFWY